MKYILIIFIIAISLLTLPQHGFCQYLEEIYSLIFSLNGEQLLNTSAGLQTFYPADLIKWEGGNHYSAYWRGSDYFVDAENIDGVELLDDGSIIFSLAASWNEYRNEDLIKWTPGIGFSMYWDASAAGVPAGNDLDAVHLEKNGEIIFSLSGDWDIYGFKDQDLIKWSPVAGFSLFWQPPELPESKDVDAVDILLSNDILFSLTSSWSYGGITYQT
ncbi:hypothetical protein L0Z72_13590, partial [candidate division KSB1 bacterium]|nr:hypothetical protein [candidate division KSB1 bacterium]